MKTISSSPEYPKFPMKEFEAELEQGHVEFKSAIQELSKKLLAQLRDQNPELMDAKITKQNDIKISITLAGRDPDGILLEYQKQIRDIIRKDMCAQIEKELGRPITPAEIEGIFTIPLSKIKKMDQITEDYEFTVGKGQQNHYLTWINENIPKGQTTRPDIRIYIHVPSRRGARRFIYVESNGRVLIDDVIKPPTVTLDTNVVKTWWKNRSKVEHVKKLLELGEKFEIDLAVTGRIRDDVPDQPLASEINDLPNLLIHEIGAIIRPNNWEPGIDIGGITEFVDLTRSIEISDEFNNMNKDNRPDWRDWDHIHTHYRYGRNYFLTWDGGLLHFKKKFQEELGITLMKPEDYLSQHQQLNPEEWINKTIQNSLQN
ncbi:MAG: hypothetical protein OXM61_20095 [Candidatus Poribacteria bacterium]|nr:hypothetical protein [Candidatus Poribacteria bacterium]